MGGVVASFVVKALGLTGPAALIVGGAIQVGIGVIGSKAFAPKKRGPQAAQPKPNDGRLVFRGTVASRKKVIGRMVRGSDMILRRAANGMLHAIHVHSEGPVHGIVEYRLDRKRVTVESDGRVFDAPYNAGEAGSLIRLKTLLGQTDQAYIPEPAAVAPDWGPAHRGRGLCYSWMRAEQGSSSTHYDVYPTSEEPPLQVLMDGASDIYDPRDESYKYTDNAGLVIGYLMQHPDGFGLSLGGLHIPSLIEAANRSDVLRPLASGGTSRMWRLAGLWDFAVPRGQLLDAMQDACGGDIAVRPSGKISINVGGDPDPDITLTDDDVFELLEHDDGPQADQSYTVLPFKYVDENLDHTETGGDAWVNTLEEARLGERKRASVAELYWAPYHAQARNAAEIKSLRDNWPSRVVMRFHPSGLEAAWERTVTLDMPALGLSGTWRVKTLSLGGADLMPVIELKKIADGAGPWTVAKEGTAPTLPPEQVEEDGPPAAPGDVQAFGQDDGASGAGIFVIWMPPADDDTEHYVAYRATGATTWTSVATDPEDTTVLIDGLVADDTYDVAVFAAREAGLDPDDPDVTAVVIAGVVALDSTPVPDAPTGLGVTVQDGVAIIEVTASASASQRWTVILRDGTEVSRQRTAPGQIIGFADNPGPGTYTWTAQAESLSGETSSVTAGVTKTIT